MPIISTYPATGFPKFFAARPRKQIHVLISHFRISTLFVVAIAALLSLVPLPAVSAGETANTGTSFPFSEVQQIRNQTETAQGQSQLELPAPIVTPRKTFDIPFNIDDPVGRLIEIQLYASTDQGRTWKLVSRTNPQKKKFTFQSVGDGQYLFALKTLDRDNRLLPIGPPTPTLNIVVDTKQPDLKLQVDPGTGGRVVTSFRAEDPNLVAESFHLSYRLDGPNLPARWVPIQFPKKDLPKNQQVAANSNTRILKDRIGWWPDPKATAIIVKAEIKDQAGNLRTSYQPINISSLQQVRSHTPPTHIQNHLEAPNALAARPIGTKPKVFQASSKKPASKNSNQSGSTQNPLSPIPQNSGGQGVHWSPTKEIGKQRTDVSDSSGIRRGHSQNGQRSGLNHSAREHRALFAAKKSTIPNRPMIADDQDPKTSAISRNQNPNSSFQDSAGKSHPPKTNNQYDHLGTMGSINGQLNVSEGTSFAIPKRPTELHDRKNPSIAGSNNPGNASAEQNGHRMIPNRNHFPAGFTKGSTTSPRMKSHLNKSPARGNIHNNEKHHTPNKKQPAVFPEKRFIVPNGVVPFLVNRRSFGLRYAVDGLSVEQISAVTVFGSADGGKTWAKIQDDQDKQSPAQILVNRPGVYGFRVVITSTTGVSSPIPKPGDRPDVYVEVDLTAPTPRIVATPYGTGRHSSHLQIQWRTTAADLHHSPISLDYSNHPAGPWTRIAHNLANTGQHNWPIGPNLPKKVYLRISAKDKAGNIGYHQLPDPINIAPLTPRGKVLGIAK